MRQNDHGLLLVDGLDVDLNDLAATYERGFRERESLARSRGARAPTYLPVQGGRSARPVN